MQLAQAVPWTPLVVLAYLATVALGTLSLRGRRVNRRWHTVLFIATSILTLLAALFALPVQWPRALFLTLALVPLALLPLVTTPVRKHQYRHTVLGLCAAPFYLVALVLWGVSL